MVSVEARADTGTYPGVSWREYEDLRERLRTVDNLIAFRMAAFNVGERSSNERVYGQLVSANAEVVRGAPDLVTVVSDLPSAAMAALTPRHARPPVVDT